VGLVGGVAATAAAAVWPAHDAPAAYDARAEAAEPRAGGWPVFAAADARRDVQVLRHLGPAADHPVNLAHSEGAYLKGLWLRVGA